MKIGHLIDEIRKRDLVLPEFQREYVWGREQAKQLMVSLVKNYPIGSLLFWKTDSPPALKNIEDLPNKLGTYKVILDGQQRLTTLYMLITGNIPPYYTKKDITTDPLDLYFNIEDRDFQYYLDSKMKGNPLWLRVIECFNNQNINVFEIAEKQTESKDAAFQLAKQYNDNLNMLRQIRDLDLPEQIVPVDAKIDEAINIFDRVNSQGTKLTDAELALTHVTGKWPQARNEMKDEIKKLSDNHFYFDLNFMTRTLTGVVTQRALFEYIHKEPMDKLMEGWGKVVKILDYLTKILPSRANVHSTEDVNTTNALVPLVIYLSLNNGVFPDELSIKQAIHWLYAALMWSRYTSQTDQRLERDVSIIMRYSSPWQNLREQIVDQRGRIDVKPGDIEGRGIQHPLYRMTYILTKIHGAVDLFNGVPLGTACGHQYQVCSQYIFQPGLMYKNGFESSNHVHRKLINEIANRVFLTEYNNMAANKPPHEYLSLIEEKFPGALVKQFIPMDAKLWHVDNYKDFLVERRKLISQKINEYMDTLIKEPEIMHDRSIVDLVKMGESTTLEFKSTLQWDVLKNEANKNLRFSVLKTIAAFMNSMGGTLIIGVEDNGSIFGLEKDIALLSKKSLDSFQQTLMNIINQHIGAEYAPFIDARFETIEGKTVCVVDVDKAPEGVFVEGPEKKVFYVRLGNTTRALDDPEEILKYRNNNWE